MVVILDFFWHNFEHLSLPTRLRYSPEVSEITSLCCLFISCVFEKVCLIWLWSNENMITFLCLVFSPVNLSAFMFPLVSSIKPKFQLLFSLLGVSKTLPCPKNVTSLFIITLCKYHIPPEILAIFYTVSALRPNWTCVHVQILEWCGSICVTGADTRNINHRHVRQQKQGMCSSYLLL